MGMYSFSTQWLMHRTMAPSYFLEKFRNDIKFLLFFAQGADIVLFGVDWSCDWCLTCCYPIHWLWIFVPFPQIIDVDASTL